MTRTDESTEKMKRLVTSERSILPWCIVLLILVGGGISFIGGEEGAAAVFLVLGLPLALCLAATSTYLVYTGHWEENNV